MLRRTACLLVVTLLLSSARLLACGWDCFDAQPVAAEASCHQEMTSSALALNGGEAHPCPPAIVDTPVTLTQKSNLEIARSLDAAIPTAMSAAPAIAGATHEAHFAASRCTLRIPITTVLRI